MGDGFTISISIDHHGIQNSVLRRTTVPTTKRSIRRCDKSETLFPLFQEMKVNETRIGDLPKPLLGEALESQQRLDGKFPKYVKNQIMGKDYSMIVPSQPFATTHPF
ncbi:hypothetical protein GQ457_02G034850 [Hibiscus cannabinus]